MFVKALLKYTALAAFGSGMLVPTTGFAESPFILGGPRYQPPVHSNRATSDLGYQAFAYEPSHQTNASKGTKRSCMQPENSLNYEPCINH
jgi:hypothetical protein